MKLNFIKLLALIICLALMTDSCIAMERRMHKVHRRFSQEVALKSKDPLVKFAEGLVVSASGGKSEWMTCLPEAWKTPQNGGDETKYIKKQFKKLNKSTKNILKNISSVIDYLCQYKDTLESILDTIFKPKGRFFIQGRFSRRRTLTRWSLFGLIKSGAESTGNWIAEKAKQGWSLLQKAGQTVLTKVATDFDQVKQFMNTFFTSQTMDKVLKFLCCVVNAKDAAEEIKKVYDQLKTKVAIFLEQKIDWLKVIKLVVSVICNKDGFIKIANAIIKATKEGKDYKAFYSYGVALGETFRLFAYARRR